MTNEEHALCAKMEYSINTPELLDVALWSIGDIIECHFAKKNKHLAKILALKLLVIKEEVKGLFK